ncbi:hypothetical protein RND71_003814 [Anisodus tanguticus]|uniref:Uncharacterized protein n=1 Tax=Anisodus tanguticus TaxID=243964 RepID=A0AAE1STZ5_9SOLA|nr:hypothetical protein RND71_003814 [Anisodus tanguticus]
MRRVREGEGRAKQWRVAVVDCVNGDRSSGMRMFPMVPTAGGGVGVPTIRWKWEIPWWGWGVRVGLVIMREVMRKKRNLGLSDMLEAVKSFGVGKVLLRFLELQGSVWPIGHAMKSCSMLRNRKLDPSFLFKVGTELGHFTVVLEITCTVVPLYIQISKEGQRFCAEFELYAADMLVGVAVNVSLVSLLAPYARIGQPSMSQGFIGRLQRSYGALPSSVFEAERPGCRFTFIRNVKKSEDDVPVPSLLKSALLWGVFLGVSSNTRLQIITGLERVLESSPVGKQFPPAAMAFTVGVRFANNVYAGMQFVDWARWSGVQ